MMTRRRWLALLIGGTALAAGGSPAPAQAPPAPPLSGVGGAPTLARAMAEAEAPKEDVYLTVNAGMVPLPKDAPSPQAGDTMAQAIEPYGRLLQSFETVTAVAPPTMTVLNTNPGAPDPYDGMPPSDALKLLLASLSDGQWSLVTGQAGLGMGDLTDARQRALFGALFPGGSLTASPEHEPGYRGNGDETFKITADDLRQAKVRLGQRVNMLLPFENRANTYMGGPNFPPNGKIEYQAWGNNGDAQNSVYGVKIRDTVPNALKDSDLDYDLDALKQSIPLDGVKTVSDLVSRVGQAARLELYADRRYEKRTVTVIGPPTARAKDLLRALALCVCGTFRKVGPAYVLTDDRLGMGARRAVLSRFAQDADMGRAAALAAAGDTLVTARGGVPGLPSLDNGLGFSDAQKAQAAKTTIAFYGANLNLPLSELTPAQQATARRQAQQWNDQQAASPNSNNDMGGISLTKKFILQSEPMVLLMTPAVPGPVVLSALNGSSLFQPSQKLQQQLWDVRNKQAQADVKTPPKQASPPPPPSLASLLATQPRRAVIAAPRTAKAVDSLIASMKTVGLNQLWLDVFSHGQSHLDGSPDILAEALAKAKGTGITIIPTVDLLNWGENAPPEARDLTILGEDSAQSAARQRQYQNVVYQHMTPEELAKQPAPPAVYSVCPSISSVRQTLRDLIQRLAATPGVAALALRETVTTGYDHDDVSYYGTGDNELGYTLPLRLAFLRKDHVDPVDLGGNIYIQGVNLDTSLPEFENGGDAGTAPQDWNIFRGGANRDFLQRLLQAAQQSAGHRIGFLVRQRHSTWQGDWYGLWDDPRAPLPGLTEKIGNEGGGPDVNYAAFAHTQSKVDILALQSWGLTSKDGLVSALQAMKPGWDGFVMDVSTGTGGDPLAPLVKSLTATDGPHPAR